MEYDATAGQTGDKVHFTIEVQGGIKEALAEAKKQAKEIFDYKPGDEKINISVKEAKIEKD